MKRKCSAKFEMPNVDAPEIETRDAINKRNAPCTEKLQPDEASAQVLDPCADSKFFGLRPTLGGVAEWLCSGLQSRLCRFDSDPRLQYLS